MSSPTRWTGGVAPLWSCTPPPPRVKKYERLPILPGAGVTVVIISECLEETRTHYVDRRTVPCTGDDAECWLDHRDVGNPRYCGWLAVRLVTASKVWLLSLTPVAVAVEPRLRNPNLDLRGLTMRVWRTGAHERSELHAALQPAVDRVADLPQPPDIRLCVERMWAAADRPKTPTGNRPGVLQRALAAAKGGAS